MHKYACILIVFTLSFAWAEEVLFVKSGDVEGIPVGSFYLSKEKVSNQDYFLFIQTDGYLQKNLWDIEVQNDLQNRFKNSSGERAPRAWEDGSPPMGEEYEAVIGISKWEARAFAKSKGWMIPSRRMWLLAQQTYGNSIGDYPWADDRNNEEENSSGVSLARYFAPGQIWEERFSEVQKEIKSAASVSQVNRNAASIRDSDRKLRDISENVENINKNMVEMEKKTQNDNQQKINSLENLFAQLNEKVFVLSQKNEQEQKNSSDRLKDLTNLVVSNAKEIEALQQNYNSVKTENQLLREEIQAVRSSEEIPKRLEALKNSLHQQGKDFDSLKKQTEEQMKSSMQILKNENERWIANQDRVLNEKTNRWEGKFALLDEVSKKSNEIDSQVKKLNSLCPPLPDGTNYVQNFLTLKSGIEEARLSEKKIQTDITFLQQKDIGIEQQIAQLKKQDDVLAKEDNKMDAAIRATSVKDDSQDKELAKLNAFFGQIDQRNKELQTNIDLLKKIDADHDKQNQDVLAKIKNAEQLIGLQGQEDSNFRLQIEDVSKTIKRYKEDTDSNNKTIELLKEKDAALDKTLRETADILRGESQNIRKKIYDEQQSELQMLTENSNKNSTEIKGLENYIENMRLRMEKRVETVESDIRSVEQKRNRLETDFRVAATQMRHNMLEVGQKMLQLFEKGMFIGPIPPDKEIHQTENNPVEKNNQDQDKNNNNNPDKNSSSSGLTEEELKKQQEEFKKQQEKLEKEIREQLNKLKVELLDLNKNENSLLRQQVLTITRDEREKLASSIMSNQEILANQIRTEREKLRTNINNNTDENLAKLCYYISQIFFQQQEIGLTSGFIQLCLEYNPNMEKAKTFWQDNWVILNTPKDMVYIESKQAVFGRMNDFEFPYRKKTVPAYFMDRNEVTYGQFAKFVENGYNNRENWSEDGNRWRESRVRPINWKEPNSLQENLPMVNVTYHEAEAYAKWKGKRLPTTEEWERAARYTDGRLYPWGDNSPKEGKHYRTNYYQMETENDGFTTVAPIGTFKDDYTPEGIFDLCGNVAEWCSDASKANSKKIRVIKGGSFNSLRHRLPGYNQISGEEDEKYEYVGFRCVKDSPK